ncbi:MAG: PspA/IM30 family protein, partial [Candidatus Thiodiazotropha sp.]
MTLITRVTRLFRADMHAVLDALEEPELLLKQAIREMQGALERETRQGRLIAEELKQLNSRKQTEHDEITSLNEELDLCFEQNNETLARSVLRQRLEKERVVQYLEQRLASLQAVAEALQQRIDEQSLRLRDMQQKLNLMVAQPRPYPSDTGDDIRCQPGKAKRRLVVPGSREAILETRRAVGA